jgi:hypothetical protein
MQRPFNHDVKRIATICPVTLLFFFSGLAVAAQNAPFISGGIGVLHSTNAGATTVQPVVEPLAVFPLGQRLLFESRAYLADFISPQNGNSGSLQNNLFAGLIYFTADYIATPRLTITAGEFLIPFGTYNERLYPIWISNFQDAPLILSIGTDGGSGLGATMAARPTPTTHADQLQRILLHRE